MTRRTVALDLDGVCYNVVGAIQAHVQAKWDLHLDAELQTMYSLPQWIHAHTHIEEGLRKRIVLDVLALTTRNHHWYWNAVGLYPEAKRAVMRLADEYNIVVITSRPQSLSGINFKMIARDFGADVIRSIHHVTYKRKGIAAKTLGCSVAIDDNGDVVAQMVRQRIFTFYVRRNYGQEIPGSTRGRVQEVGSVFEAVNKLYEMEAATAALRG